jgi:putative endonuclease
MTFLVYVLQSEGTGRHYIGHTYDLTKRLKEHNNGLNASTRERGPWKVIYKEEGFVSRNEAIRREKEIKRMKCGIQFKKLLENNSVSS